MKKINITFDDFFKNLYQDRWTKLKSSLALKHKQVVRSSFRQPYDFNSTEKVLDYPCYTEELKGIFEKRTAEGLKKYYVMDPASIICAKSLNVQEGDFVLDMCAAPGGKSLILLESIKSGELWCNEVSEARRHKLKNVIQEYVPKEIRGNVFIKGKDGNRYGLMHPDTFDRILVDAPCSGESHLINSPKELEKWSENRTKRLSRNQYSLLCSALLACKSKGTIVYSTCSISRYENDGVIERILSKKKDLVKLDLPDLALPGIERTEFGYIFLPDKSEAGPIYFSRLVKL
jgi:16S rRNA C967 or C1407 C5-methylase (RsmB/RsmF family)